MSWGDDFLALIKKKQKEEDEDIGPVTDTIPDMPMPGSRLSRNDYNRLMASGRYHYYQQLKAEQEAKLAMEAEKPKVGLFDGLLQPLDDGWDQGDIMSIIMEAGDRIVSSDAANWVGAKTMSGLSGFTSGIASTADLILGKPLQAIGWENNPISVLANAAKADYDHFAKESERYEQNMGGGAGLDFAGQAIEGISGAVPNALFAFMTAGTSAAGSAAATTGSLTNQALYQSGNILTKAGLSVESMMHNPQYWLSVTQTLGPEYEEAKAMGADDATATLGAIFTSLINAGIENGTNGLSGIQGLPSEIAEEGGSKALKWALSSIEEGGEEGLQKLVGEIIAKTMYDSDAEILNPLEYAKEMGLGAIAGAALGGGQIGLQSASNALSSAGGRVETKPLTKNEQAVVDKVYQDAVAQQEAQKGKKLTTKEKATLYDAVLEQMEKGYIGTDIIEEVLGGDTYKSYRETIDSEDSKIKELEAQIQELEGAPNTVGNAKMYDTLQSQLDELKNKSQREQLKSQLGSTVSELVKDDRLSESYAERDRSRQAFQADLSQYPENQRATVQAAIDSGVLNNTNRSHEFVDLVAKLAADKGVPFNFADNAKLKESGFALEGVTVNGFVNSNGVTINVNSAKALNAVVGHEITHVLEGTKLYDSLATAIETYAKGKGDYDTRLEQLTQLYEGKEGYTGPDAAEKIRQEVVADLVGDYVFTDKAFVQQLSTEHRGLFQKIYDKIKYLCKMATAGSKEARQLLEAKKIFAEVYRETAAKKPTGEGGVRYSLNQFEDGKRFVDVQMDAHTFDGMTVSDMNRAAKSILMERFAGKVIGLDNRAFVNGDSVNEYLHPSKSIEADIRKAKLTASGELDNLLDAGEALPNEPDGRDGHIHPDAIDFSYYKTIFKVGDEYFEGIINIKNIKRGKLLKDITKIRNITKDIVSSYGENPKSNFLRDASMDSIRNSDPVVNTKNSLSADGQVEDHGPVVWQVKGEDVALEQDDVGPVAGFTGSYSGTTYSAKQAELLAGLSTEAIQNGADLAGQQDITFNHIGLGGESQIQQEWIDAGLVFEETDANGNTYYAVNEGAILDERARRANENKRARKGPVADHGPVGQQVKGEDVVLEDIGTVVEQVRASEAESVQEEIPLNGQNAGDGAPYVDTEQDGKVSEYAEAFSSEEDLMEAEISQMDEAYRRLAGEEGYSAALYDTEEGAAVDTVARRLEVKQQNLQWELEGNQRHRQQMIEAYDQKIAEAQAKYDAKKNKRTKVAAGLLRQIQRLQRLKADRLAEFDKRMHDIQSRMGKVAEDLNKDHSKQDKLEMIHSRIDKQLETDKAELAAEFDQRRKMLAEQIGNKIKYIKDQAQALYMELRNLKKGVRASAQLGYLKDAGFSWSEIRQALADVSQSPTLPVHKDSAAESAARELLLRDYDTMAHELEDLDNQYQQEVKALEEQAAKEKQAATVAHQRKVKQGSYEQEMAELAGDTSTWVDKKVGISYQTNTLRRNLRDVVRDADGNRDIEKADAIYDALQGSYNRNEAELNRESNRIKKPYADMKINKYEDAYIQMLGELRHNPDTKLLPWDVEEYYQKHKKHIDTAKVDKAIEMARETYDSLLQRVNEVLREQGMQEIPYRKGYFPHFTEEKQGLLGKLLNWKTKNDEIPTDIAGLTEQFNPNRSWQSFNKERKGDTTDYSFLKGMDTYVQGALDWIYHIEDIQKRRAFENHIRYVHSEEGIQEKIDAIRESNQYDADEVQEQIDAVFKEAGNPLNNFVTDLRTGTNKLAGKKSSMDRGVEQMTNRKVYSVMTNISNRVSANMVGGSISSALTNFIPITQSWGQVSPKSSLRAIGDIIRSAAHNDGMVDKSTFLTNRLRGNDNLYKTGWDKAGNAVSWFSGLVDNITSQTVWRSKYLENIDAGMSESAAIEDADQFAENIIAGRSRGNMPTIFESKNPVTKIFTAFQLEVANQYGYMLKDMPQDMKSEAKGKLVAGYAKMFIGAYVYNALYSSLTGRDAAFDPIRIVEELLRDVGWIGDEEEEEPVDALMGFAENVMEELPFVGGLMGGGRIPISSALPYDGNVMDFIEGTGKLFLEGDTSELTEWLNPVYYLLPPMGGGQIRKTVQGLSMFSDDHPVAGSYTDSGDLRFPVEDTFGSRLKAGLFGQWASQNAQDYIDHGRTPLSQERIEEFMETGMTIDEYWDYLDGIRGLDTLAEKADYIDGLDLTTEQKNILINNLADRDDPIDMTDYEDYSSFEEFDYATKNPEKYAFLEDSGIGYAAYAAADEDGKRAYTWAYENPGKYTMSQAISEDFMTFYGYKQALSALKSDKDEDGNTISGSKKQKAIDYINGLDLDYGQKVILYRMMHDSQEDRDQYNMDIIDYLNSRDDISYSEMETILIELGFQVDEYGNITWD